MHQFLEAAAIALQAIWANKLRSLLTVLGNIVAVTSIIAVVSLVQGLNASVKDAIQSQVGADTFTVQRTRHRRSPTTSSRARRATRASRSTTPRRSGAFEPVTSRSSWREADASAPGRSTAASRSTASAIRGVTKEYISLPTTNVERGRPDHAGRIRRRAARRRCSAGTRPTGSSARSIRSTRTSRSPACTSRSSASRAKKGSIFGQSQDEFAVIPLGAFQQHLRHRGSRCSSRCGRRDPSLVADGDGRDDGRAAHRSAACGRSSRTTSACSRRTRSSTSTTRRRPASSRF